MLLQPVRVPKQLLLLSGISCLLKDKAFTERMLTATP